MKMKLVLAGIVLALSIFLVWQNMPAPMKTENNAAAENPQHEEEAMAISPQSGFGELSTLSSETGQVIADIGYHAEKITEQVNKENIHVVILKSYPCTECDIGPELILYNVEAKKKKGIIHPGTSGPRDLSDGNNPPEIDSMAHGFYGFCGSDDFGVWIIRKNTFKGGKWNFYEDAYTFTSSGISEENKTIDLKYFEKRFHFFQTAPSCHQLKEEAQTWCC